MNSPIHERKTDAIKHRRYTTSLASLRRYDMKRKAINITCVQDLTDNQLTTA